MKLKLEKEQVTSLSNSEMELVHGGGIRRSNNRNGNCAYSRKHPDICTCTGKGGDQKLVVGCVAKAATSSSLTIESK